MSVSKTEYESSILSSPVEVSKLMGDVGAKPSMGRGNAFPSMSSVGQRHLPSFIERSTMITLVHNNLIWYTYKGDEIAWDGEWYISICSEGRFSSLYELDMFWKDYFKEMEK